MSHRPGHPAPASAAASKLLSDAGYPRDRHWKTNITYEGFHPLDAASKAYVTQLAGRGWSAPTAPAPVKPTHDASKGAGLTATQGSQFPDRPEDPTKGLYTVETGSGDKSKSSGASHLPAPPMYAMSAPMPQGMGGGHAPYQHETYIPYAYGQATTMFPSAHGMPTGYMDPYAVAQGQAFLTMHGASPHLAYGLYDATPEEMAAMGFDETFSAEELAGAEATTAKKKKKKRSNRSF